MNEIGLPSYISTPPMDLSLALASRMNGFKKSGIANTGVEHKSLLNLLKCCYLLVGPLKISFFEVVK
jgi:hypothetical protein